MPQVIRHARYSLQIAADAAGVLNRDKTMRQQWLEMAENIADVDSLDMKGYSEKEKKRYYANSPEFFVMPHILASEDDRPGFLRQTHENSLWSWYFGHLPKAFTGSIRNGDFVADRDYQSLREILNRWRLPNGL